VTALDKAVELFLAGRFEDARRSCRRAVRDRPDLPEAHILLAEIHRQLGDEARARESIERVSRLRPGRSEAHLHLLVADLLGDAGRYGEAEPRYRRALELDSGLSDARYNLAGALSAMGRADESIAELQALLGRDPRAADARERLARLLQEAQRFEELETVCREGMALHPEASGYPLRLGVVLWRRGREEEGLQAFRDAVARAGDPGGEAYQDAKLQEANALLALGRYDEGWRAFHWRHPRARLRKEYPQLVEDPSEIAALKEPRRIRIVTEQGLGDEIFFLRFAVALRARGHRLDVVCEPKLAGVLAALPDLFESVNAGQGGADFTLCSGDLPLAGGQGFALPLPLPVDSLRRAALEARLRRFGPPPYVGVTWRSGVLPEEPKPQRGSYLVKQVSVELLGAALRGVDARVVSLQRKPVPADARKFGEALGHEFLDLSEVNEQLPEALALLSLLDEYVGVSNTNTHLRAGLPGCSARVLVRTPPEWRWEGNASASPWFPGFKVYRQRPGRDWPAVLDKLGRDLSITYAATQQK
jgi:Flp pilus assembly protein TadD